MCALDNAQAGTTEALATRPVAAAAVAESARRGYLDGDALASVFSWLRPNDLIWNYVVNNYLLGKEPPAFDILYWNQDTVRMAAGLHRDFVMMALESALATPGGMRGARQRRGPGQGRPRHLHRRRVQRPHRRLAQRLPLDAAARRRQPLRALDERSHPGADQPARRRTAGPATGSPTTNPPDVADWEAAATTQRGSWWPDYIAWLRPRVRRARARAQAARQPRAQGDRQGARHLRAGGMSEPVPTGRWWGDHVGETRWLLEAARLRADPVWRGRDVPHGDGRGVVLVPGFGAGDHTLAALRAWLRRIGYRPAVCGFVVNADCSERALERVERRVAALHARSGRRVAVIGHSRGGHFARAVAAGGPSWYPMPSRSARICRRCSTAASRSWPLRSTRGACS